MQHEAHPGLPDYGEVSSRERALETYAQDLHRRIEARRQGAEAA